MVSEAVDGYLINSMLVLREIGPLLSRNSLDGLRCLGLRETTFHCLPEPRV